MSRLRRSLPASEEILFEAQHHWVRYASPVVLGIVGLATFFAIPAMQAWLPIERSYIAWLIPGGSILTAILWFYGRKSIDEFHEMAVTDTNIISTEGIGRSRISSLRLEKVEFVRVEQTLLGRMLGYGDILVVSQGKTSAGRDQVKNPVGFRNKVISERDRAISLRAQTPSHPKSVSTQ